MTKTELKKQQVKAVIELLINQFNAEVEDADGGRMDVFINGFHGQFSRRDFDVCFYETTPLNNPSDFDDVVVERQKEAVALEDKLNKAITNLLK